jgi:hypothetical protein
VRARAGVRVEVDPVERHAQRDRLDVRHVLTRDRGVDAGQGQGLGGVDAEYAGVSNRRAHHAHPQLPREVDVVDEASGPAQQSIVLDPEHPLPDVHRPVF